MGNLGKKAVAEEWETALGILCHLRGHRAWQCSGRRHCWPAEETQQDRDENHLRDCSQTADAQYSRTAKVSQYCSERAVSLEALRCPWFSGSSLQTLKQSVIVL